MEKLLEIIRGRQPPGIMVFDGDHRLLYSNPEMLELFPDILAGGNPDRACRVAVPAEVLHLCEQLRQLPGDVRLAKLETTCALMAAGRAQMVAMRAFFLHGQGIPDERIHTIVLVEKVVENHARNFAQIQQDYNFSRRELDVLRQICAGLSNRAIADKLFISEHTVKDHIKHIMKKMQVSSRNGIVAALKF